MFDLSAIIKSNQEQAAAWEDLWNKEAERDYHADVDNWLKNAPVREALGLAPEPKPFPPAKFRVVFDAINFRHVISRGPVTFDVYDPKPADKPVFGAPPVPGNFFPGRTDYRMTLPGDNSPVGTKALIGEEEWTKVGNPFAGTYWARTR